MTNDVKIFERVLTTTIAPYILTKMFQLNSAFMIRYDMIR